MSVRPSFRLGTTSYIIPAGLVDNVRYLAGRVQDIELVLFDRDDGLSNLPDADTVAVLGRVSAEHGLSYTVHLPEDLPPLNGAGPLHPALHKARRVIELTRPLQPLAYVAHLDGRAVRNGATPDERRRWQVGMLRALERVGQWAGGLRLLAVENLEGYPLDFLEPSLQALPLSRCVDVGHLWLDGHDPLPYLQAALPRTRVVHLHGIRGRAHQSLDAVPTAQLQAVLALLQRRAYQGVLTMEIFGQEDFLSSLPVLHAALR